MMDISKLFKGMAVVIDDEVGDDSANIRDILNQIEVMNIPYLTYTSIPKEEIVANFQNLSFLLLDWRLIKEDVKSVDLLNGVTIPATLENSYVEDNIEFLKKLKDICFCPVFIFSNENQMAITAKLEEKGVYLKDKPSHVLVKSKNDLTGKNKLLDEIEKWIKENPSVYVLKEWEREYQQSKNKLFLDFQELSPEWPTIMWGTYKKDKANESLELGELISRNLHTRMAPFEFSEEVLETQGRKIDKNELRKVLEGERYLKNSNLHENDISPGDVFKDKRDYYVNIRAACDCIPDRSRNNSTIDDVQLYLLPGSKLSDEKTKEVFNRDYDQFNECDTQAIVFPVDGGKALDFRFKKMEIKPWKELKRIGRILPPFITRIQQRYASYLIRQGLPRTPNGAVLDEKAEIR